MNKLMAWVIVPLVLSSAVSCSRNTTLKDRFSARKDATRIISMLNAEQFVDAETSIRNDLKKKKLSNDGQDWGYLLFDCLTNTNVIKEDTLNRWCQQSPNSFPAFLSRGYFYVNYSWYARGSDWADTVSEDRWQQFYDRLAKAKADLEKAAVLDAKSAYPYSALIKICTGLGLPREQMENYFQSAIRLEPTLYPVYRAKLVYLMPKWHGTVEDLFGFARQVAANAPKHSAVPLVLAEAHMEIADKANDTSIYLAKKDVREEMESIYAAFFREFPKYYERARYFKRVKKYA